jgi:hypothetical protein
MQVFLTTARSPPLRVPHRYLIRGVEQSMTNHKTAAEVRAREAMPPPPRRMQVLTTAPRRPALPTGTRGDARGQRQARAAR